MPQDLPPLVQDAPPEITPAEAAAIARDMFGVDGAARSLGSNQDRNFVIDDGTAERLLKIANPGVRAEQLEAQSLAARLIRDRTAVRVPTAQAHGDGSTASPIELGGVTAHARLLEFLPGSTLSGSRYLAPAAVHAIGALAASVDVALADLDHPGADASGQWDLRRGREVVTTLLPSVRDAGLRGRLDAVSDEAWDRVLHLADRLPVQVIHGDLTDDNVVTSDASEGIPDGVIDLGDLTRSWRIAELAITVSSLLHHDGVGVIEALRAVTAYDAVCPLESAELDAFWPLLTLRAAVLVASAHHVLLTDPDNAYATENLEHENAILAAATSLPHPVATALVRAAAGQAPVPLATPPGTLLGPDASASIVELDLSPTSAALDGGRFLEPHVEDALVRGALAAGARIVATRFGEPRLTRSPLHAQAEPDNVALGVTLTSAERVPLVAPWDGEVQTSAHGIAVRGAGLVLEILGSGVTAVSTGAVAVGDPLATFMGSALVRLFDDQGAPRSFVAASALDAWRTVAADPTPLLLGRPTSVVRADRRALLDRRDGVLAGVQEHYFADPPVMVRGWREHLVDADGRIHLDTLNNVTSIGHGHPRMVEAISRQWSLLNTNSRFHYPSIVEFAERIAELLPDGLDRVFLVNSGSEAVDLALRLARAHTGRREVLAVREAYHGWTDLSDAVSTSIADNPAALQTRPEWVHTVEMPHATRGRYRGADASRYAVEAVQEIERLAAAGTPPGAFIAESVYGNAGGVLLPDGYLTALYGAVRAHGGVAVADEVQVGYGRLGEWFWGFEQQGVVPDIVAVAKAMGAGHPLGAVITTSEIAQSYRENGYFFSSAGGSPVSSIAGITVLDIIRDEGLQQNAAEVGSYLRDELRRLGERHAIVGDVHGSGFYLGPELIRDRETLAPATRETAAICERLRLLGVMAQPTGDHQNVLKIKPPMCFSRESADALIAALDRVLETGW